MKAGVTGGGRRPRWWGPASLRIADLAPIALTWSVVLVLVPFTPLAERSRPEAGLLVLAATVATWVALERRSVYEQCPPLPRVDETARTATAVLLGATAAALLSALTDIHLGAREVIVGVPLTAISTFVVRGYRRAWQGTRDGERERIVIIGTGDEAAELAQLIDEHPDSNLVMLGIVGDRSVAARNGIEHLWLGPASSVTEVLIRHQADAALINATGFRGRQFRQITQEVLNAGFKVRVSTGITRLYCGRFTMRSLVHEPLVAIEPQRAPRWQLSVKRAADVCGASLALVLAAPVLLVTAAAIKLEDGGPVFFRQKRTGIGGAPFMMTKFRSMVPDAELRRAELEALNERSGPLFKVSWDPRVTRVGRIIRETSIDELPQLLDVLRGDMSLVGPRPPLPAEHAVFDNELQGRFQVRPGITGLWQVEARSNASFNAYRRLDLHYVENWSLWMDLRILLATAEHVLVSLATVPLRPVLGRVGQDSIAVKPVTTRERVEIDLREPQRELRTDTARAS